MSETYLSQKALDLLNNLLKRENNKFGSKNISEDEYKNIKEGIEELKEASLIKISWIPQPYQVENRIYRIKITNSGKNYFNKRRKNRLEYWTPHYISWVLSILAIIISIISLYR